MYEIQPELQSNNRYLIALDYGYTLRSVDETTWVLSDANGSVKIPNTLISVHCGSYVMEDGSQLIEKSYCVSEKALAIISCFGAISNQESVLKIPGAGKLTKQPSYIVCALTGAEFPIGRLIETTQAHAWTRKAWTRWHGDTYLISTKE